MNSLLQVFPALLDFVLLLTVHMLLILAIRKPVARFFGAANAYRLWLLPVLWLPFHWLTMPTVDWSALATLLNLDKAGSSGVVGVVSWFPLAMQNVGLELDMPVFDFMTIDTMTTSPLWKVVVVLWLGLAMVLGLLQAWAMLRFSRELQQVQQTPSSALQEAVQRESGTQSLPRLACVQGIGTPALFGILRPVLLLPVDFLTRFDATQRRLILAHELVHYRRRDNAWNLLATVLRILFWFNPLVHFAWRSYRLDQELSCDAIALGSAQGKQGLLYAKTLIESAGGALPARHQPTFTAWGELREIRERTRMIKLHASHTPLQSTGKWLLVLLVVLGCQGTASLSKVLAQEAAGAPAETTTRGTTMRREVQELLEQVMKLREDKDNAGARVLLDQLRPRAQAGELNEREAQVMFQFYASLDMAEEDYEGALANHQEILKLPDLTPALLVQTWTQVGAIQYQLENYREAIAAFNTLVNITPEPNPDVYLRIAYAYYQLGEFPNAISPLLANFELLRGKGEAIPRNSYALLRSLYLTVEDYTNAHKIAGEMAELFNDARDRELLERLEAQVAEGAAGVVVQAEVRVPPAAVGNRELDYLPIVTVPPSYPSQAITNRVEGWVQVQFDVNEEGAVVDPKVVDASPAGVFDQASLVAIAQFKFNPREVDGVPQLTEGVQYVFRFNLQDE